MRRLLGLVLLCSAAAACGRGNGSATLRAEGAGPFYELYAKGDATTDQAAGAPGSHSSLVGTDAENADVQDADFATNVAGVALKAGAKLFLSLGECFSGGFIDDLAPLGGAQAVITSARHSETASYGTEAPEGVDVDYTDAFITGLADGKNGAEQVASITAALDPFGPNPDAHRISETMGSEHTQYWATPEGKDLKPADYAGDGIAVLWAGMPAERDGKQMNLMIDKLVAMGWSRDRIWFMYGGGQADGEHPVVRNHIANQETPVHMLAATREHLVDLFKQSFEAPRGQRPSFVFLYVGDHGGLDFAKVAKQNFDQADALVTPVLQPQAGEHLYGEGFRALR